MNNQTNRQKHFGQHRSRLTLEAILKSFLWGLAIGFIANFAVALALWLSPIDGLWISLAVLVGVTLIAACILYLTRFRPTDLDNARRMDSLGLEERLVTMVEHDADDSYISRLQRRDAEAALSRINKKQIKFSFSTAMIATLIVCALFGTSMTTVSVLSGFGIIPDGNDILSSIIEDQRTEYVTISYVIDEGGMIDGDEDQIIVKGTDATTITAVADDGYMFKQWSDGSTDPTRSDVNITEDLVFTAEFTEVGDEEGDGDGDGEGDGEGDEPNDAPSDSGNNDSNSGESSPPSQPAPPSDGAGGANKPNNQIINGEIYYREVIESYIESANDMIESDGHNLSEAEIELIKKYLGIV